MAERVMLIGMMGSGKTTVGRLLAKRRGWAYLDSDEEIVKRTGRTVREIFETDGEAAFRREESAVLADALACGVDAVISVAGGAVLDETNRERISAAGTVVWLRAPIEILAERAQRQDHRPLIDQDPEASLRHLYRDREPIYGKLADLVVEVDDLGPEQVVDVINVALG